MQLFWQRLQLSSCTVQFFSRRSGQVHVRWASKRMRAVEEKLSVWQWIWRMQLRSKTRGQCTLVIKQEICTSGGSCLYASISLVLCFFPPRITDHFSFLRGRLFSLWRFPDEALLLAQTVTCMLYSLEDEWLSYRSLVPPDSILSKPRINTSFWSTEADRDPLTIQNGNIKHDLLHRSWQ